MSITSLHNDIKKCTHCVVSLPCGANPIVQIGAQAKILIIGQAPGLKVHQTSIPWNDASGDRLRDWLGVTREQFYDADLFGLMPMGFCYPGTGKSGDLPPRPECAPLWHARILKSMPYIQCTLLIGQYAQSYYLKKQCKNNVTETVRSWQDYWEDGFLPLVHPSPRNGIWLRKNPWFEADIIPHLRNTIRSLLST